MDQKLIVAGRVADSYPDPDPAFIILSNPGLDPVFKLDRIRSENQDPAKDKLFLQFLMTKVIIKYEYINHIDFFVERNK